jgi:hypothetical protein
MRWLAVAVVLLAGCTDPSVPSGGVEGAAMMGPTCPVERDPPEPGCEDRPFVGELEVVTSHGGKARLTFQTASDGTFRVRVSPGTYEIRSPSGTAMPPTCGSPPFNVAEDAYTPVAVSCDTGIR